MEEKRIQTPLLPPTSYMALNESFSFNKVRFLLFKKIQNLKIALAIYLRIRNSDFWN